MRYKKRVFSGIALLILAGILWPVDVHRATPSPTLLSLEGTILRTFPASDGQIRLPVKVEEVDPLFIKMLTQIEDHRFHWHPGFDPAALIRAGYQWMHTGGVVSGGSTLTMQVARLLHPASRTLPNKIAEIWRSIRLSAQYNKREILNFYLQLAPYGGDLAGVRTATLVYFGKEPKQLTPDEIALLIALPQNPNAVRPDRFPLKAQKARAKVLQRLLAHGAITQTAFNAGMAMPVPSKRYPLPTHALHLADRLRASTTRAPWRSTINAALQAKIEALLQHQLPHLSDHTTIAAMVVDNQTHAIAAYIGNADYFASDRAGNVDIVTAIRSPGSTLKPFVYGMAFQDGIAHPATLIRDEPTRFGSYAPSNFNQGYLGEVTLRTALQQSLNIPAVKILSQVGTERWLAKLRATGVRLLLPDKKSTAELPIILGGLGTSLWDLTTLYVGLANGGQVMPLEFLQASNPHSARPLLSTLAAWQVTDILIGAPLSENRVRGPKLQQLAIKTGTSYGYRDAWAIGFTPNYTVSVWVGRADGSPVPDQAGRKTAVPILLSIYDVIPGLQGTQFRMASTAAVPQIPEQLRYWLGDRAQAYLHPAAQNALSISYPLNHIEYHFSEIDPHGIQLNAEGGSKPYQWYENGMPIPSPSDERSYWQPKSPGFYKITVVDQTGHTVSHHISITT